MDTYVFKVDEDDAGLRADKYLAAHIDEVSRTRIQQIFEKDEALIMGRTVKPSYKVKTGDVISITLPEVVRADILPEDIPIDIVYEDDDVAVVDKPQGMVVHPAPGNYSGTLVNALMYRLSSLSSINGIIRPGIVHRIDKDTSGLLVIAKNDRAHEALASQFAEHSVTRRYIAVVHGVITENEGVINAPIGRDKNDRKAFCVTDQNAKHAVTHYSVLKRLGDITVLRLRLETGRTHQIRVHMKYIGHPVVGDRIYGRDSALDRKYDGQLLHAAVLGFAHPADGREVRFVSQLPDYFTGLAGSDICIE